MKKPNNSYSLCIRYTTYGRYIYIMNNNITIKSIRTPDPIKYYKYRISHTFKCIKEESRDPENVIRNFRHRTNKIKYRTSQAVYLNLRHVAINMPSLKAIVNHDVNFNLGYNI